MRRTQPALKAQRKSCRTAEYLSVYCMSELVKKHKRYDWTLRVVRQYFSDMYD